MQTDVEMLGKKFGGSMMISPRHAQRSRRIILLSIMLFSIFAPASAQQDYVWWEAEAPKTTNFPNPAQNPFAPQNEQEAAILSGGKWIGVGSDRNQTLFLEYDVT